MTSGCGSRTSCTTSLGHHVSLINVQAGVALYLMDDDPEQARSALAAIKQSSRDLLREMRATLGVLRGVDDEPPHHPVAGLAHLDELVATRTAGLPVEMRVEGDAVDLPPASTGRVPDRAGGADQHPPARRAGHARPCSCTTPTTG